jgi:hypothetical protein
MSLVFVLGMTVAGCKDDQADRSLNGTWIRNGVILKLNNGEFEELVDGKPAFKGTYTTDDAIISMMATHVNLDSKWYSKDEYEKVKRDYYVSLFKDFPGYIEEYVNRDLEIFSPRTYVYNVDGNSLTLGQGRTTYTFTRNN